MKNPTIPFGFISEVKSEELKSFKPTYFLVMGEQGGEFEPMTFDYSTGVFCWSYYSGDTGATDEVGELYDKATAMKLISHHVINSGTATNMKLFPVHVPFIDKGNSQGYSNPYLVDGVCTDGVRVKSLEYIEKYGEKGCDYHMPASLGGEYIATGQIESDEDEISGQEELYMITAIYDSGEEDQTPSPLCRGVLAPLTWANIMALDNETPPHVFNRETAETLIKEQAVWDVNNTADETDRFVMYLITVCRS